MNKKQEKYIQKFNTILLNCLEHIEKYHNYNILPIDIPTPKQIKMTIAQDNKKLITYFIHNIYIDDEYRKSCLDMNDDIYIKNYSNWNNLSIHLKIFIKKSVYGLCILCEKYILLL